jgi:phage repressor protein C with HTH and peptisase S24 domain
MHENFNLLSERLNWCRKHYQIAYGKAPTQSEIAGWVGLSRAAVNLWFSDSNGMSTETAIILEGYFHVNYKWIKDGEGEPTPPENKPRLDQKKNAEKREFQVEHDPNLIPIRRVDFKLSAGISGYSVDVVNGDLAPIFFRKDWIERNRLDVNNLFALRVSGHSMETSLYDEDLVVVNTADTKPTDGDVFAINYEGELVIKRMIRQADGWVLSSDNPDKRKYADKVCHENCIVLGRVIYKQSERI